MKNIMRSIWYEVIRSKMMLRIFILLVLFMALAAVLNVGDAEHTSGMIAENPLMLYEFSIFLLSFVVGIICGSDYKDKVANYEVLSGHSRLEIYLARSLMGVVLAAVMAVILSFVPLIAGCIKDGWGNALDLRDTVIRVLLLFFPYMRLAAFMVVLTFLIKNQYIMMAVGFGVSTGVTVFVSMIAHSKSLYVSFFNMNLLTSFDGWSIYNVDPNIGVVQYFSYDSSLSAGLVMGTIGVSLCATVFYLVLGYALFRRDELN